MNQNELKDIKLKINNLEGYLDINVKREEIEDDQRLTTDPAFWNKPAEAEALLKR